VLGPLGDPPAVKEARLRKRYKQRREFEAWEQAAEKRDTHTTQNEESRNQK